MRPVSPLNQTPDQVLDITRDRCPMTYVRVRLALDRMLPAQLLLVRLQGDEPLRNVPLTATEQGHRVLDTTECESGVTELLIRKAG